LEDGQKEVLNRVIKLEDGQKDILETIKKAHSNLKNEIVVTALAVKETVREEIKRVENKLDEHIRQPAHIGVC
jgi:predicted transcriptional regulator